MKKMKHRSAIMLYLFLFAFWLILAPELSWVQILIGAVVALLIVLYNFDLVFDAKEVTKLGFKSLWVLLRIFYTLVIEIIKANLNVVKIVLSKKMPIDPGFVTIRQPLKKKLNQTLYGNAITLTPGTLTIDMNEEEIIVHGLKVEYATSLENSHLEKVFIQFEEAEK